MNYNITQDYKTGDFKINDITINENIFQEELFDYIIEEREQIIDNLIMWIGEGNKDKELMKDDLKYLMTKEDVYLFSSISTNEYILKSDDEEEFNNLCKELLELNKTISKKDLKRCE
jgi:hypothetical protein